MILLLVKLCKFFSPIGQIPREEDARRELWSEVGLRIVALTLRASPPPLPPLSASQDLEDSVPYTPGRGSGEESEESNGSHETGGHGGEEEEAARNRTLLLEAIQQFSKQWRVTPHVFFMLGK